MNKLMKICITDFDNRFSSPPAAGVTYVRYWCEYQYWIHMVMVKTIWWWILICILWRFIQYEEHWWKWKIDDGCTGDSTLALSGCEFLIGTAIKRNLETQMMRPSGQVPPAVQYFTDQSTSDKDMGRLRGKIADAVKARISGDWPRIKPTDSADMQRPIDGCRVSRMAEHVMKAQQLVRSGVPVLPYNSILPVPRSVWALLLVWWVLRVMVKMWTIPWSRSYRCRAY